MIWPNFEVNMLTWQEAFYIQTLLICPGETMFRRKMLGRWFIGQWVQMWLVLFIWWNCWVCHCPSLLSKLDVWWCLSLLERWNGKRDLSLWSCLRAVWDNILSHKSELVPTCLFSIGSANGSNIYVFAWVELTDGRLWLSNWRSACLQRHRFPRERPHVSIPNSCVAVCLSQIWTCHMVYTNMVGLACLVQLRKKMRSKGLIHREHFSNTKHSKDIIFACVRLGLVRFFDLSPRLGIFIQ